MTDCVILCLWRVVGNQLSCAEGGQRAVQVCPGWPACIAAACVFEVVARGELCCVLPQGADGNKAWTASTFCEWLPGQRAGFHDGRSAAVAAAAVERRSAARRRRLRLARRQRNSRGLCRVAPAFGEIGHSASPQCVFSENWNHTQGICSNEQPFNRRDTVANGFG